MSTQPKKAKRASLDIPSSYWIRLRLALDDSGKLELFCLYPWGTGNLNYHSTGDEGQQATRQGIMAVWKEVMSSGIISSTMILFAADVTYEGLFYDYFDTGAVRESKKLFCPVLQFTQKPFP